MLEVVRVLYPDHVLLRRGAAQTCFAEYPVFEVNTEEHCVDFSFLSIE